MWDPTAKVKSGDDSNSVYFKYKDNDDRMLHLSDFYFTRGTDDGIPPNAKGTWSSFGAYGRAVEIVTMICYMFGGYVLERDIEDKPYYRVNKSRHKFVKLIFQ